MTQKKKTHLTIVDENYLEPPEIKAEREAARKIYKYNPNKPISELLKSIQEYNDLINPYTAKWRRRYKYILPDFDKVASKKIPIKLKEKYKILCMDNTDDCLVKSSYGRAWRYKLLDIWRMDLNKGTFFQHRGQSYKAKSRYRPKTSLMSLDLDITTPKDEKIFRLMFYYHKKVKVRKFRGKELDISPENQGTGRISKIADYHGITEDNYLLGDKINLYIEMGFRSINGEAINKDLPLPTSLQFDNYPLGKNSNRIHLI